MWRALRGLCHRWAALAAESQLAHLSGQSWLCGWDKERFHFMSWDLSSFLTSTWPLNFK